MLGDPQVADRVVVAEAGDHRVQPHRTIGVGVLGDDQGLQVRRAEPDLLLQLPAKGLFDGLRGLDLAPG